MGCSLLNVTWVALFPFSFTHRLFLFGAHHHSPKQTHDTTPFPLSVMNPLKDLPSPSTNILKDFESTENHLLCSLIISSAMHHLHYCLQSSLMPSLTNHPLKKKKISYFLVFSNCNVLKSHLHFFSRLCALPRKNSFSSYLKERRQ